MNPQEPSSDQFSGRMGLIFATIGAAIGTGNTVSYTHLTLPTTPYV